MSHFVIGGYFSRSLILAIAISAILSSQGTAQTPKVLFKSIDPSKIDLTDEQARILARIKKSYAYVKSEIVSLDREAVPHADIPLTFMVGKEKVDLKNYHLHAGMGTVRLTSQEEKTQDFTNLSLGEKNAAGLIYQKNKVFAVENLGGGLQAMVEINQANFPEHKHPVGPPIKLPRLQADSPLPTSSAPALIRVLVAYTKQVEDSVASVPILIDSSISLANQSYVNSKVNIRMELAKTVKVNYTESATHDTDLARFKGKQDGYMDEIHDLRKQSKADVCVLLINNSQFCGLADAILADADTAFAVVHYDCAFKNLSFAHEVGHLQGPRHNWEADPTEDPNFPWNHGFLCDPAAGNWRTIMAYASDDNPIRIPYWSNPNVSYGTPAVPTGTSNKNNNARMLNLTASRVSMFHALTDEPPLIQPISTRGESTGESADGVLLFPKNEEVIVTTRNRTIAGKIQKISSQWIRIVESRGGGEILIPLNAVETITASKKGSKADAPPGKSYVVYVHGICQHDPDYSLPWWNAMKSFVSISDGNRKEVLWSDLTSPVHADASPAVQELAQSLADTLRDRSDRQRLLVQPGDMAGMEKGDVQSEVNCVKDFAVYLLNSDIRNKVIGRFTSVVGPLLNEPGAEVQIISHSWGTVVAYEGLCTLEKEGGFAGKIPNWFTVGSALSISQVKRRLLPIASNGHRPNMVSRWSNLNARFDIVGGALKGRPFAVDDDYLGLEPVGCSSFCPNPVCSHGSYFVPANLAVNRDLFGKLIK